jgi:hypothetical protein
MALFRHKSGRADTPETGRQEYRGSVTGLAEYAAGLGWHPLGDSPFDGFLADFIHEATRVMYGAPRGQAYGSTSVRVANTAYRDAYGGTIGERDFAVANAWTSIGELHPVAVCAVEVATVLPLTWVQPRAFAAVMITGSIPVGDAAFEERFVVHGQDPAFAQGVLTDSVRELMMARDDWIFVFERLRLACLARHAFTSGDDVQQRLAHVQALMSAIPPSVLPPPAEQAPDLLARLRDAPDSQEAKATLAAMTGDQRAQFLAEILREREARRRR